MNKTIISASIVIRGSNLQLNEVEEVFNCKADESFHNGDEFIINDKNHYRVVGFWEISSSNHVVSNNMQDHIEYIINKVKGADARKIKSADIFYLDLFFTSNHLHEICHLKPNILMDIALMGLSLKVSSYHYNDSSSAG